MLWIRKILVDLIYVDSIWERDGISLLYINRVSVMFWFQIQESLSWVPVLHGHGTASSPKLSWDAFSHQFHSDSLSMVEWNSTGVKNENTHKYRSEPLRLRCPRSRPGTAAISGAASRARRHLVVPEGWCRQAGRCAGPCTKAGFWGHCPRCYGEKRKHCEASLPLGYFCGRAAAVGTVSTSILVFWSLTPSPSSF